MKKLLIAVVLFASLLGGPSALASSQQDKATWLWNPWMFYNGPDQTIAFLNAKEVSHVFVQLDADIPASKYHAFIKQAHQSGMKVYALDGAPHWVLQKGTKAKNQFKKWLQSYQTKAPTEAKFDGVHLDIEPYALAEWDSKRGVTVRQFQTTITEMRTFAASLKLPFEADIPFWFDEIKYANNVYGKGNLAEWTIRNTDGVAIMAYRDTAQAIIEISSAEMKWAEKYGKKVRVGVETMKSAEHPFITFYEEGELYMNQEVAKVQQAFAASPAFSGISIHHVDSWKTLKP